MYFVLFWCIAWGSNSGLTSNKPTHYLLDYSDFENMYSWFKNKIKISVCLILIQILYCSHNSVCHCTQLDLHNSKLLYLLFFFTPFCNTQQQLFDRSLQWRFSKDDYSQLHTDWLNSFGIRCCSAIPLLLQCKSSDEYSRRTMSLPSRNLYKCKHVIHVIVVCVFCLRLSLQCCCWLFIYLFIPFFILMLLLYLCLFVDHCYGFDSFCLSFLC